jgi:methionyl-tRNA formyltransferase
MRVAIIGQQAFGQSVFEAFRSRGDEVAGVFCAPAPGAWTAVHGRKLRILEARKHPTRRFTDVSGKPGEITHIGHTAVTIAAQGGSLELLEVRLDGAEKSSAASLFTSLGLTAGMRLDAPK